MSLARALLVVTCALASACLAQEEPPAAARRPWGPEQAAGKPDTPAAGDAPTAWATLLPDSGPEWLRLDFERAVQIAEVRVRETFNPGAVARVAAVLGDGTEQTLWEGRDPTVEAPDDFVVRVPGDRAVEAKSVRILLDTARVPGWNEIDAVELVGRDGTRQWAAGASASSTHAGPIERRGVMLPPQQALEKARVGGRHEDLLRKILVEDDVLTYTEFRDYGHWAGTAWKGHVDLPPGYWVYVYPHWYIWRTDDRPQEPPAPPPVHAPDPFQELVGRPVKIHLENAQTLDGLFVRTTVDFIVIQQPEARKALLVNKAKIVFLDAPLPPRPAHF